MPKSVHLTTAQQMLRMPDPVDLTVLNKDGQLLYLNNCIGLKLTPYTGCRRVKLLDSGQIRQIRDCLIMQINGMPVFM
jgi:hypothetical protein